MTSCVCPLSPEVDIGGDGWQKEVSGEIIQTFGLLICSDGAQIWIVFHSGLNTVHISKDTWPQWDVTTLNIKHKQTCVPFTLTSWNTSWFFLSQVKALAAQLTILVYCVFIFIPLAKVSISYNLHFCYLYSVLHLYYCSYLSYLLLNIHYTAPFLHLSTLITIKLNVIWSKNESSQSLRAQILWFITSYTL